MSLNNFTTDTNKEQHTTHFAPRKGEIIEYRPKRFYSFVKRCFDILASLLAIILLSPVILVIAILIKCEDGGHIIHKRECVGKEKNYNMLKFRTMYEDADNFEKYFTTEQYEQYKKEIKLDNDPRITKIGRFLRKTSLDELAQLFNVIRGDMSIVGPRPAVESEIDFFGEYRDILLSVKPGITGYWQVNGRSNCTYESGERQRLELYYVTNRSVALDIKILFKTVFVILKGTGAK